MIRIYWLVGAFFLAGFTSGAQEIINTSAIEQLLANWDKPNAPGYAVAVVKNGQPVYYRAGGMANIEKQLAVDTTTLFWVASVTKQFTATAIYILAAQRKIEVKKSIRYYIDELPKVFEAVTVDHLIHHTSGIRDGFVLTALSKKGEDAYTNENVLKYLKMQRELSFSPGTEFEYNNSGYVLLALAIEKVTGRSFPEYVRENVLVPLGMDQSFISGRYEAGGKMSEGYQSTGSAGSSFHFKSEHFNGNSYGSTGLVTNIADLVKWTQALQNKEMFRRLHVDLTTILAVGKLNTGKDLAYAGGLEKFNYDGITVYEHFGADPGFKANIILFPGSQLAVIGLTNNSSNYELSKYLYAIADIFLDHRSAQPAAVIAGEQLVAESYFYDPAKTPALRIIRTYKDHVGMKDSPDGYYMQHASITSTSFKSADPIPTILKILPRRIAIHYPNGMVTTAAAINVDTTTSDLVKYSGEYYSPELDVSYSLSVTGQELFLDFVPGVRFKLFRLTSNDFVFDYSGPNFIQLTPEGFQFSRDGIRKLKFIKR